MGVLYISMQLNVKKKLSRRLKIAEGQLRGVQKMIDDDKYCIDIINQTSAIRHALTSIEEIILKNHLSTCVIDQMKNGAHKKAVDEILSIYSKQNRK